VKQELLTLPEHPEFVGSVLPIFLTIEQLIRVREKDNPTTCDDDDKAEEVKTEM
jgi:hypothetical protein